MLQFHLKYAVRSLLRRPAFAATAIITLALGIGANTAMFSIINTVFLKPLPVREPERLAMLWSTLPDQQLNEAFSSYADFKDWSEQSSSFRGMAAYWMFPNGDVNLTGGTEPQRVSVARITPSFFSVLGVAPLHGREFVEEETIAGNHRQAILSYGLWRQHFGGDTALVGKTVQVNGVAYTVVGIMPRELGTRAVHVLGTDVQLWRPLVPADNQTGGRGTRRLRVIGRLAPNATLAQAQSEIDGITQRLAAAYPESNRNVGARLIPVREQVVRDVRRGLMFLLAAVAVVLVGACANVANLLLIRGMGSRKQIAVQHALGAGRIRLAAQVLSEAFILGSAGAVTGVLLAVGIVRGFRAFGPADIPLLADVRVDGTVLIFGVAIAFAAVVAAALLPAWHTTRVDDAVLLRQSATRVRSKSDRAIMKALGVSQIAMAMVLLTAGGLLVRSFQSLLSVDPGIDPQGVLTFQVELPMAATAPYPSQPQRDAFFDVLHQRLTAIPGVTAVGIASAPPFEEEPSQSSLRLPGDSTARPIQANFRMVSPNYFALLRIPVRRGTVFEGTHDRAAPPVVVVSEALARSVWTTPDSAVGKRVVAYGSEAEVIGVVGDVRTGGLDAEMARTVYLPTTQGTYNFMTVLIRSNVETSTLLPAVRSIVKSLDAAIPLHHVQTVDDMVVGSVAHQRFQMLLIALFSCLMLALAVVGTYGVSAYSVSERTAELGVRSALGATSADIRTMVLKEGGQLAIIGCAVGAIGVALLSGALTRFAVGVDRLDPVAYVAVPFVLIAVVLLATLIPAQRAARVDPIRALKSE